MFKKIFNVIFVISGVVASLWRVFIKFRWHGQKLIGVLLMVHTGLVLAQHMSLAWSTQWYQLISEAILLFTNYYSLFKIVRDYIVFSRLSYTDKEGKENWKSFDCCIVCTRCNSCWKHQLDQLHVMIQLSISQKMKETWNVINSSWLS